jgi:YaiO family outer membrane protein
MAVPLTAQSMPDLLSQAHDHEAARQYEQAAAVYRLYLAEHAEDDEVRAALARVLSWQNRYEEAVTLYEEILARHPADADIRVALARIQSWQKKFAEAQAGYRSVLRDDPDNREAKRGLADTLYWSGEYEDALRVYQDLFETATADDPVLTQRIDAVRDELAALTPAQLLRAPVGLARALPTLPFRDYLKLGYSHYTYTHSIPDEQNGLVEMAKSIGTRTLVGRVEPLNRFGLHDTVVSGELYSPLWEKAWGYIGGLATADSSFAPNWSLGGEVFQGLGKLHKMLSFLEPSVGYRHMEYRSASVDLLIPGLTVYLPYSFWITEKVYLIPETGATTLLSQLTWRPTDRLQCFMSGAFGTSSSQISATQDFAKVASYIIQGGMIVPLSARFSVEASGYYEDRSRSYVRRGGSINLIAHW